MVNPFSSKAFSIVDSGPSPVPTQKSIHQERRNNPYCDEKDRRTPLIQSIKNNLEQKIDLPEFIIAAEAINVVTSQTIKIKSMNNGTTK